MLQEQESIPIRNRFKITGILVASFLLILPRRVMAQMDDTGGGDTGDLVLWIEGITLLAFGFIVIFNIQAHRKLGNSLISLPFTYMIYGITILLLGRLLLVLHELEAIEASQMVITIYWHILVYISMIAFIIAIKKVADRLKDDELKSFSVNDMIFFLITIVISITLFFTTSTIGVTLMELIADTFIPEYGLLHFTAFAFTGILTIWMISVLNRSRRTNVGKLLNSITPSFLVFLALTTLNHLTELVTATWAIISIDDTLVHVFEQLLWTGGFSIMAFGFFKLLNEISKSLQIKSPEDVKIPQDNENVIIVEEVLTNHIGTLAQEILKKSSLDSGITLTELDEENIAEFGKAVENNTSELIGDFPSKFLNNSIQEAIIKK